MSQFQDLIKKAKSEPQPQRLLFLFAKTSSMLGEAQSDYHSGTIDPVMCVDKLPEELSSFQGLVDEADEQTKNWDFILVSSLSGKDGRAPESEDADAPLQKMTNALANGEDLAGYVIWNRKEETIITG